MVPLLLLAAELYGKTQEVTSNKMYNAFDRNSSGEMTCQHGKYPQNNTWQLFAP